MAATCGHSRERLLHFRAHTCRNEVRLHCASFPSTCCTRSSLPIPTQDERCQPPVQDLTHQRLLAAVRALGAQEEERQMALLGLASSQGLCKPGNETKKRRRKGRRGMEKTTWNRGRRGERRNNILLLLFNYERRINRGSATEGERERQAGNREGEAGRG